MFTNNALDISTRLNFRKEKVLPENVILCYLCLEEDHIKDAFKTNWLVK